MGEDRNCRINFVLSYLDSLIFSSMIRRVDAFVIFLEDEKCIAKRLVEIWSGTVLM